MVSIAWGRDGRPLSERCIAPKPIRPNAAVGSLADDITEGDYPDCDHSNHSRPSNDKTPSGGGCESNRGEGCLIPVEMIGTLESTYHPAYDVDVPESTRPI